MDPIAVLLIEADDAGITITLDNGKLSSKGPRDHPIVGKLRENKTGILVWLDTIGAIEKRMINGQAFLIEAWKNLADKPDDEKMTESFLHHLHLWATLDDDLRDIYGYEGCPVGACDRKQPLVCRHCAKSGKEE